MLYMLHRINDAIQYPNMIKKRMHHLFGMFKIVIALVTLIISLVDTSSVFFPNKGIIHITTNK